MDLTPKVGLLVICAEWQITTEFLLVRGLGPARLSSPGSGSFTSRSHENLSFMSAKASVIWRMDWSWRWLTLRVRDLVPHYWLFHGGWSISMTWPLVPRGASKKLQYLCDPGSRVIQWFLPFIYRSESLSLAHTQAEVHLDESERGE